MSFELTPEQLIIIGLVASALTMIIRFIVELARKAKVDLPVWFQNVVVFIAGGVLAYLWMPTALPPLPVPSGEIGADVLMYLSYAATVLAALTLTMSFAVFIYRALLERMKPAVRRLLHIPA